MQLLIAPWDALDAAAIQCLILIEFVQLLCLVDETTVILPYKHSFAVKGDVLFELEKLGQLYTAISKYFQGFTSRKVNESMYVSVLLGFDYPSGFLHQPALRNGEPLPQDLHLVYSSTLSCHDRLVVPVP